jgi:hypothetical protein
MADVQLIKQWKAVETVLSSAYRALPLPTEAVRSDFEVAVADYRKYLEHNELELALDALAAAAELVAARGGVWRDLERAAQFMELSQRAADLHARFLRAVAAGGT